MKFIFIRILFVFSMLFYLISCNKQPDISKIPDICFNTQVLPIFQNNCAMSSCHDVHFEDGIILTNYDNIYNAGIKPGDPKNSLIYKVITENYGNYMPPQNPLTLQQRQIIEIWIMQGAKNTICDTTHDSIIPSDKLCFNQDILPILLSNCAISGCHDAITHQENMNLSTYSSLMSINGMVIPNNPNNSKLIQTISPGAEELMPPSPMAPLSQNQIDLLKRWINEGATNDNSCNCDTSNITYTNVISPIISNSCKGCHSGSTPSGGIALISYNDVKAQIDNGKLWTSINLNTGQPKAMPPGGKLTNCKISQIRIWKDAGAPNN